MHIFSFIKYCQLLKVVILNYTPSNDVQEFSFLGGTESLFSIIISLFSSISPCTQDIFPDFTCFLQYLVICRKSITTFCYLAHFPQIYCLRKCMARLFLQNRQWVFQVFVHSLSQTTIFQLPISVASLQCLTTKSMLPVLIFLFFSFFSFSFSFFFKVGSISNAELQLPIPSLRLMLHALSQPGTPHVLVFKAAPNLKD